MRTVRAAVLGCLATGCSFAYQPGASPGPRKEAGSRSMNGSRTNNRGGQWRNARSPAAPFKHGGGPTAGGSSAVTATSPAARFRSGEAEARPTQPRIRPHQQKTVSPSNLQVPEARASTPPLGDTLVAESQGRTADRRAEQEGRRLPVGAAILPAASVYGRTAPKEALYVVDGTALLYKSFFSKAELEGYSKHHSTLIMFGMELGRILAEVGPSHVACAFDCFKGREHNVRRTKWHLYKANRDPVPPELRRLLPEARDLVKALGILWVQEEGYEADDIMATLSHWAHRRNLPVVLVTEDKDLYQAVTDRVLVLHWRNRTFYGPEEVEKKSGVPPQLHRDLLGLAGDQVDGIPGVRGVGQKTGAALVKAFGPLEDIYCSLDQVAKLQVRGAKTLAQKLLAQKEEAFLFREVATLVDNLELKDLRGVTSQDLKYRGPALQAEEILEALGFMGPLVFVKNHVPFDYY